MSFLSKAGAHYPTPRRRSTLDCRRGIVTVAPSGFLRPPSSRAPTAPATSARRSGCRRRPTEMPLKARKPRLAMLNRPMTRPRMSGGALSWTRLCAMALKDNSRNPAANRKRERQRIASRPARRPPAPRTTASRARSRCAAAAAAIRRLRARCRPASRRRRPRPAACCRRRRDRHGRGRWQSPASANYRHCRRRTTPRRRAASSRR